MTSLGLRDPGEFVRGFARPNLEFRVSAVAKRAEKLARLSAVIDEAKKGIVYCATRKRVEEVAEHLEEWGVPHIAYHAGLDDAEREARQNEFSSAGAPMSPWRRMPSAWASTGRIIRFVVHFEIPAAWRPTIRRRVGRGGTGCPRFANCFSITPTAKTQDFFIDGRNPAPSRSSATSTIL